MATIVYYCLQFIYNIQNGGGSFNPGNYRYFEYCFTCPFIVLDVCYSVELPHKVHSECIPFGTREHNVLLRVEIIVTCLVY